jgi:hypothetical protein
MKECDNKFACHTMKTIVENDDCIRSICETCKRQYICRKDNRKVPEKKLYARLWRKFILQGKDNLFYKYNPQYLR